MTECAVEGVPRSGPPLIFKISNALVRDRANRGYANGPLYLGNIRINFSQPSCVVRQTLVVIVEVVGFTIDLQGLIVGLPLAKHVRDSLDVVERLVEPRPPSVLVVAGVLVLIGHDHDDHGYADRRAQGG